MLAALVCVVVRCGVLSVSVPASSTVARVRTCWGDGIHMHVGPSRTYSLACARMPSKKPAPCKLATYTTQVAGALVVLEPLSGDST